MTRPALLDWPLEGTHRIEASAGTGKTFALALLHTRLVVERVLDQDAEFLRFVEEQQLMPGSRIVIDSRDPAADAVRVLTASNQVIAVGTRAASNILVSTGVIAS